MPNNHGRFAWHRLNTTDPDAAVAFYSRVTPWMAEPWEHAANYTLLKNDGHPVGGVVPLSDEFNAIGHGPHWLPYVGVYDVDDCTRQVPKLGGTVRIPMTEIPNVGCWAVISDPLGATVGIYEPDRPPTAPKPAPAVGEFSWHELATTDYKRAFEFYKTLFHWDRIDEFDMGEMGIYCMYGVGGQLLGGMFNDRTAVAPNWLCYVRVDDVKAAAERVAQAGGSVASGPMEVPSGAWIAQCTDAQGARFALQTSVTD